MATFDKKNTGWYTDCPPVVNEFKALVKKAGHKIEDSHQTLICVFPSGFRVMISRVSQVVQCYYLECGWDHTSTPLKHFKNPQSIWDHAMEMTEQLSTDVKEMRKRLPADLG
jgi:hypothetical protein